MNWVGDLNIVPKGWVNITQMSPDDCRFQGSGWSTQKSVEKLPLISVDTELGLNTLNYGECLLCALESAYLQGGEGPPRTAPERCVPLPARIKQKEMPICPCTSWNMWISGGTNSWLIFLSIVESRLFLAETGRESKVSLKVHNNILLLGSVLVKRSDKRLLNLSQVTCSHLRIFLVLFEH